MRDPRVKVAVILITNHGLGILAVRLARGTTLCVLIVVAVAASAVNAQDPDSVPLGQLLADPNDCSAYYQFVPQRKVCPLDLMFNAKKQVCDWPHNVACSCNGTGRRPPPANYTHLPGMGYYKRHEEKKSWDEARRACESEGAYLAIPDSLQEMEAISNAFGCCPWIGIYRLGSSGPWITVHGKPISSDFQIWKAGQPRSSDCGHLFDKWGGISGSDACEVTGRFLCEFRV